MKKVFVILFSIFVPFFIFAQEVEAQTAVENVSTEENAVVDAVQNVEATVSEADNIQAQLTDGEGPVENQPDESEASEVGEDSTEEGEETDEETEAPVDERALAEAAAIEKYNLAKDECYARIEEIKASYLDLFKTAADKKETAEAELGQQTDIQAEMDKLRLVEDEIYATRRSDEETLELNRRKSAFDFLMTEKKPELSVKVGPEENMLAVEAIKTQIWDLRENVRQRAEAFNAEKDAQTEALVDEITNAPYVDGETDSSGEPTRTALQRRSNRCDEAREMAEIEKENYLNQLKAEIAPAEKQYFSELATAYRTLEAGKYFTNSFTEDVIFRVSNFNAEKGYWNAKITSGLFGHIGILEMDFELTYEEVTGKPFVTADKMTDEEFEEFNNTVAIYDYFFRTNANVISAKVYFTMYKWRETNEYRFTPSKLEIIRVADSPKVIHKETRIQAKPFIYYGAPVHEVRSEADIAKDALRAAKIVEKEQKKAGTYNPAYSYNGSSTKDLVQQKGRGAFALTAATVLPQGSNKGVGLDQLCAEVTFGLGKFGFIGADFGIDVPFIQQQIMEFGIVGGANCKLGPYIRPFAKATVNVNTEYNAILKAGVGVDFTFGIFMLTFAYDYGWYFDYNNRLVNDNSVPCVNKQKISAGFGLAF